MTLDVGLDFCGSTTIQVNGQSLRLRDLFSREIASPYIPFDDNDREEVNRPMDYRMAAAELRDIARMLEDAAGKYK